MTRSYFVLIAILITVGCPSTERPVTSNQQSVQTSPDTTSTSQALNSSQSGNFDTANATMPDVMDRIDNFVDSLIQISPADLATVLSSSSIKELIDLNIESQKFQPDRFRIYEYQVTDGLLKDILRNCNLELTKENSGGIDKLHVQSKLFIIAKKIINDPHLLSAFYQNNEDLILSALSKKSLAIIGEVRYGISAFTKASVQANIERYIEMEHKYREAQDKAFSGGNEVSPDIFNEYQRVRHIMTSSSPNLDATLFAYRRFKDNNSNAAVLDVYMHILDDIIAKLDDTQDDKVGFLIITSYDDRPDLWSGQRWFGIYTQSGHYYLKDTPLIVRREYADCGGALQKTILVESVQKPIALVRGFTNLREGALESAERTQVFIKPEKPVEFRLVQSKRSYSIRLERVREDSPRVYNVVLSEIEKTQTTEQILLRNVYVEESLTLLWAGDLDKDHKLDMIIYNSSYPRSETILFVSSMAKDKEIVHEAGRLSDTSC